MNKTLLATAIILALAATPTVFAKGKPQVETGNNLSFATMYVPVLPTSPVGRLACGVPVSPTSNAVALQCTLFSGYWCQKTEAVWQAACTVNNAATPVTVAATWGANLLGDAPLKAGRPIRVEMTLSQSGGANGLGYVVTNLTPELEDRLATYGANGVTQTTDYIVYDQGATLHIEKCADPACAQTTELIPPINGPMSAEVNSIGKIVYGFNWGTSGKFDAAQPGIYKLTFTAINTTIDSVVGGAQTCTTGNCTFVIIEVTQSAGGGGSGRK